jgi:hypothetical protein
VYVLCLKNHKRGFYVVHALNRPQFWGGGSILNVVSKNNYLPEHSSHCWICYLHRLLSFSCWVDVLFSFSCNDHQIKKSMATDTRNSAAQAAANQKNQTPKPPAPASPWNMSTGPANTVSVYHASHLWCSDSCRLYVGSVAMSTCIDYSVVTRY